DSALAGELSHIMNGTLPDGWDSELLALDTSQEMATRDAGKIALNAIANKVPWFIGGAADLAGSTKTQWSGSGNFSANDHEGRNLFFGVREHAMGAIVNGLCHHGMRALGSTFLVFSDYMRGSIRLSSLSHLSSLWVFTHDSVFVGEDGPTHQPIEHVAALRLIPGLKVYRPADTAETFACWREAFASGRAAAIIETRQKVKNYATSNQKVDNGAYVLRDSADAQIVLVASGSEVGLAMESADALAEKGVHARVVSMPCRETFMEQSPEYRSDVLPGELPRISLEAGVTYGWRDVIGDNGIAIGIDRFGTSAPGDVAYAEMGMTVNHVVDAAMRLVN
ncbi:MAG: transketolase, partial [Planctomycetales bacterium]|nr:transketolase [Planctomycetales bacterium]